MTKLVIHSPSVAKVEASDGAAVPTWVDVLESDQTTPVATVADSVLEIPFNAGEDIRLTAAAPVAGDKVFTLFGQFGLT